MDLVGTHVNQLSDDRDKQQGRQQVETNTNVPCAANAQKFGAQVNGDAQTTRSHDKVCAEIQQNRDGKLLGQDQNKKNGHRC
jgi:hypothetical protein